ncbi:MAG TPA: GNAT family protein [Actinomycetota bacterium]|nr:GNAT family protein [Actinomycetota bacterium]
MGPFRTTAEIGYWISSSFEGRGLISRSARELTRLAFEHVGVHRAIIRAGVGNVRSRAVPERLGYRQEGLEGGGGKGLGGYYDMVVYAMVEEDWRTSRGDAGRGGGRSRPLPPVAQPPGCSTPFTLNVYGAYCPIDSVESW